MTPAKGAEMEDVDIDGLVRRLRMYADAYDPVDEDAVEHQHGILRQAADCITTLTAERQAIELEPWGFERGEPWPGNPPTAKALAVCIADLATDDRMGLEQRVRAIIVRDRVTVRLHHEARAEAAEALAARLQGELDEARTVLRDAYNELHCIDDIPLEGDVVQIIAALGAVRDAERAACQAAEADRDRLQAKVDDAEKLIISACIHRDEQGIRANAEKARADRLQSELNAARDVINRVHSLATTSSGMNIAIYSTDLFEALSDKGEDGLPESTPDASADDGGSCPTCNGSRRIHIVEGTCEPAHDIDCPTCVGRLFNGVRIFSVIPGDAPSSQPSCPEGGE